MSLDLLRATAQAATQEPWERNGRNGVHTPWGRCVATTDMYGEQRTHDAEHIATFDPPTVLALLDVAQAAEAGRFICDNIWPGTVFGPDEQIPECGQCRPCVLLAALARVRALTREDQT